jgi:uncharacterized membrane protein YhaH (DUF805 family)
MDYAWFLFKFDGRINRAKYWLGTLVILCCMMFALILLAAVAVGFGLSNRLAINLVVISASVRFTNDIPASNPLFPQIVIIPMTLLFGWCYAAIAIKRLHDLDKSGWWMIPYIVATGINNQFGHWLGDSWAASLIGWPVFITFIWGLVEMYWFKGTRGLNRFGPDPLAPRDTRQRWDQQGELEFVPHRAEPFAGA